MEEGRKAEMEGKGGWERDNRRGRERGREEGKEMEGGERERGRQRHT